jgi:hypothetical protein
MCVDEHVLNTLLQADHIAACEFPPGFNWESEMNRVRVLQPVVETITGRRFEIDENVQDASFFTDLGTYREKRTPYGGTLLHTILRIRFSAFGNLFTVGSVRSENEQLDRVTTQRVIDAAEDAGLVFVDADDLDCEYTGANPHLTGTSWWIRFFDYL